MLSKKRPLIKMSLFIALPLFAVAAIFGVRMSMPQDNMGIMSRCPFAIGEATICQMNIMEHIAQWQQTFLNIPTKGGTLTLAALLLAVVLVLLVKPPFQLEKLTELAARLLAYHKINLAKVFDPLTIAFSDGILNPKIY